MLEFGIGDYVEILPKSLVEKMLKEAGCPITGIIVAKDEKEPDTFYVWEEDKVEHDQTKTTKARSGDLVLISGSMDSSIRRKELQAHADWFKRTYPSNYVPETAEVSTAVLVNSGDELTLEEAEYIVNLLKA